MKIYRQIKIQKLQNKNNMIGQQFNTLSSNERRIEPVLGSAYFDLSKSGCANEDELTAGRQKARQSYYFETDRLLKLNPSLKLI